MDEAFARLRAFARNNNRGLTEVAEGWLPARSASTPSWPTGVAPRLPAARAPDAAPRRAGSDDSFARHLLYRSRIAVYGARQERIPLQPRGSSPWLRPRQRGVCSAHQGHAYDSKPANGDTHATASRPSVLAAAFRSDGGHRVVRIGGELDVATRNRRAPGMPRRVVDKTVVVEMARDDVHGLLRLRRPGRRPPRRCKTTADR